MNLHYKTQLLSQYSSVTFRNSIVVERKSKSINQSINQYQGKPKPTKQKKPNPVWLFLLFAAVLLKFITAWALSRLIRRGFNSNLSHRLSYVTISTLCLLLIPRLCHLKTHMSGPCLEFVWDFYQGRKTQNHALDAEQFDFFCCNSSSYKYMLSQQVNSLIFK